MVSMTSTIAILKEVRNMNKTSAQTVSSFASLSEKIKQFFRSTGKDQTVISPFRVVVDKETSDHVRSWRFIILIAIIALTCFGSLYASLSNIGKAIKPNDPEGTFIFLKLFTTSDGTLPSFFVFISFLGPLLGIGMGFDAINSEQNRGTLSRVLAQPIHRDYLLNAKFLAALKVISILFFSLSFLTMGLGLIFTGIPPTMEEFLRIITFTLLSIIYVAFWLNLSIFFSVKFRQPATSALAGIAIWLFTTVFYPLIVNVIVKAAVPSGATNPHFQYIADEMKIDLLRILPNELFSEATTTILMPSVRSLGPLTMQQVYGTIPGPLPFGQSILLVWPQVTGLIAATILCFVLSYISFMRREIRSR
jgi:ABC-2 type transport system permease protein